MGKLGDFNRVDRPRTIIRKAVDVNVDCSSERPGGFVSASTLTERRLSGGRLHGLAFVHEMCLQLRGQATDRQVTGARVAAVAVGALPYVGCMLLRSGT